MIVVSGHFYVPDSERDMVMLSSGTNYQANKFRAALEYVKCSKLALDIGAHCGLWTGQMLRHFDLVQCFEPLPMHVECWKLNIGESDKCVLNEVAVGAGPGKCAIEVVEDYSGRSYVKDGDEVTMVTIDQYGFEDVGLIKIDTEGYEYHVVSGARDTLKRCKPVVIVEQKPGHASRFGLGDTSAVALLEDMGAKVRQEIAGDYIMSWD